MAVKVRSPPPTTKKSFHVYDIEKLLNSISGFRKSFDSSSKSKILLHHDEIQSSVYKVSTDSYINNFENCFNHSQFQKTLPKSSLQMHWIPVRFYEMGDRSHKYKVFF